MNLDTGIQILYQKYKSNIKYNTSLILSEIVAPFGAAAGAYILNRLDLNNYLSSSIGGLIGNYISAVVTFGTAWYVLNRGSYSNKTIKFFQRIRGNDGKKSCACSN